MATAGEVYFSQAPIHTHGYSLPYTSNYALVLFSLLSIRLEEVCALRVLSSYVYYYMGSIFNIDYKFYNLGNFGFEIDKQLCVCYGYLMYFDFNCVTSTEQIKFSSTFTTVLSIIKKIIVKVYVSIYLLNNVVDSRATEKR